VNLPRRLAWAAVTLEAVAWAVLGFATPL